MCEAETGGEEVGDREDQSVDTSLFVIPCAGTGGTSGQAADKLLLLHYSISVTKPLTCCPASGRTSLDIKTNTS